MFVPIDLPIHYGKRSQSAVGVRASQQGLEAAPIPAGYQTVIFSACLEFSSCHRMVLGLKLQVTCDIFIATSRTKYNS